MNNTSGSDSNTSWVPLPARVHARRSGGEGGWWGAVGGGGHHTGTRLQQAALPLRGNAVPRAPRPPHAPWCTSKSKMSTRRSPCARCACRAATHTLPTMQKPMPPRGSEWCPGGRQMANPAVLVLAPPPPLLLGLPLLPPPGAACAAAAAAASRSCDAATTASTSASTAPAACVRACRQRQRVLSAGWRERCGAGSPLHPPCPPSTHPTPPTYPPPHPPHPRAHTQGGGGSRGGAHTSEASPLVDAVT